MTPLAALIRDEILERGPIGLDRFMELALYHPSLGYYLRKDRDPFGARGDFYTASQVQPVFGRLIARAIGTLRQEMGTPGDFTVVELGPGRGEMAEALKEFRYLPIEAGDTLPEKITGVVFSNEFFDALPVRAMERRAGMWHERRVAFADGSFVFTTGEEAHDDHLKRFAAQQTRTEVPGSALHWMKRIGQHLHRGFVLSIDYGYTTRETLRFPQGTLMSYRGHVASEEILADPGERDISSHVCFDALREAGAAAGLETLRFETLSQFVLREGERDRFAELVREGEELALKTLLYGMGETFRVLLQRKA